MAGEYDKSPRFHSYTNESIEESLFHKSNSVPQVNKGRHSICLGSCNNELHICDRCNVELPGKCKGKQTGDKVGGVWCNGCRRPPKDQWENEPWYTKAIEDAKHFNQTKVAPKFDYVPQENYEKEFFNETRHATCSDGSCSTSDPRGCPALEIER
jgi:hypothetical protein